MQSWNYDLGSPRGDVNVSQTMNTGSKCLGGGAESVRKSQCKWDSSMRPSLCRDAKHTANMHLSINFVSRFMVRA